MRFVGDTKMDILIGPGCEFETLEDAMRITEKPGVPRSEDCKFSNKPITEEDRQFAKEVMEYINKEKITRNKLNDFIIYVQTNGKTCSTNLFNNKELLEIEELSKNTDNKKIEELIMTIWKRKEDAKV
jgi:hypothetical protein